MKKAMNKNKNITVEEQFKRRQKEAAIVTSLTFGVLGAIVGGLGIALAVSGVSVMTSIGGAVAALAGLGMLACAYPLYRKIDGKKDLCDYRK